MDTINYALVTVVIVSLIGLVLTLLVAGKSDENYSKSTKKNITSLTAIYIIAIAGSIIAFIVFIVRN